MSEVAIEVNGIWKKFHKGELHDSLRDLIPQVTRRILGRGPKRGELDEGDFWALQDVSFSVDRGEAMGIIGANGAGKSTMLKILTRILRPNRGNFRVYGSVSALIEVSAGFHPDLTGRENIYLNGAIIGMKKREIDRKLEEIIDFSGIESFVDTPVKRYSSGMQARLGFSVMAHMEPEVLLVDEVLSVGDVAFRAKCVERMLNLIESGVCVVFVSHRLEEVKRLCDRCLVLEAGGVRFDGEVEPACTEYLESLRSQTTRLDDAARRGFRSDAGRLVGLTLLDENGHRRSEIRSHSPVTLAVSYELSRDLSKVGMVVGFHRADGSRITNCDTILDGQALPGTTGKHTVNLKINGLPFGAGDYLVSLRLFDLEADKTIDQHDRRYPLPVDGAGDGRHAIDLDHAWSCDASGAALEAKIGESS